MIVLPASEAAIQQAAEILKSGGIVAMPTETVYGLAANALSAEAVAKIFQAKGRPGNNPLIVHVPDADQARELVDQWPAEAKLLSAAFWPGPLTIVLPKRQGVVPSITTAGGETVAIRCPNHPVALSLIRECGFSLAAPSANRSNAVSPTQAAHVVASLGERVPLILDGGPCHAGIESTVLSLVDGKPRILRPGVLSAHFLSEVLERKVEEITQVRASGSAELPTASLLSPGQMPLHYSPSTPLLLVQFGRVAEALGAMPQKLSDFAVMQHGLSPEITWTTAPGRLIKMPETPEAYARQLYAVLHELDTQDHKVLLAELPPESPEWTAIWDRLGRAGKLL